MAAPAGGVYIVPGQADLTLAIGAGGDKTISVPVEATSTHVKIKNEDMSQHVLYTFDSTPSFPADWKRVDPQQEMVVPTGGSTILYVRKKIYIRSEFALNDVPVSIQVGELNVS